MKACGKRILYLVLALALTVSLLGTAAFAEAFSPTNAYVFAFGSNSGASEYAYFSPFVPLLTYDNYDVYGYSILFGLKNTYTDEISEIAYCTDMPVDAVDANYQRLNLTDSTYAASHANKLRAIVLNSYPHLGLEDLQTASGIEKLSVCEAITGTQLAIWKTAHGDIVQIKDFLYTASAGYGSGHSEPTATERSNYINGSDEYKAAVKGRIEALYNYLMGLPEREATATVISEAAFTERSTAPTVEANEDGTYNVTVTTTVSIPTGSEVKLAAYMADGVYYTQTAENITSGTYTLTIPNVPAEYAYGAVTLSIDGTQNVGEDVFLLDADGIRGVSQSMIAPLSGTLPVHAEVKAEPDRVLNISKTAGGAALQNISFEVYYVGSVNDYRDGKLNIGSEPTPADIEKYAVTTNLVGTITTDEYGYGSLNLSTADGVYLVKELPNELVTDPVAFFVSLPDWVQRDGEDSPRYTITAYPKNTLVEEKVEIEKDVTKLDNEHDTFDVGEEHTWIIQSSIPAYIATGRKYEVSDTLDYRLSYRSLDKVELVHKTDKTVEPVVLEENHYTLKRGTTTDDEEHTVDTFTVSLTEAGRRKAGAAGENAELRIYFTAYINTNAGMGVEIPNQAHVKYTNNLYLDYEADSDTPEVHTGGAVILKVDKNNASKTLAGATFAVYRMAGPDEQEASNAETYTIGTTKHKLIPVSFYANETMTGDKVDELTTDENGKGYIYGLAYGEYYLVETKAPDGYNKLAGAVKITIDENSHKTGNEIKVENTTGAVLPETGGIGTQWFVLGGAMLMLGACAAAVLLRRKERA